MAHESFYSLDIIMDTVWYHALVSCLTIFHPIYQANLVLGVGAENIRVTSVEDRHDGATEKLSASGTKLNLQGVS